MRFALAIELYVDDMRAQGRLNSPRSETSYRHALQVLADDVQNRDPRHVGREDIRRTLRRYPQPNTQRRNLSMFRSFFDWMMEEGHGDGPDGGRRKDNPARQVRAPRARRPNVGRLTLEETRTYLAAATGQRERRIAYLGVLTGARRDELRLFQGRHFARKGFVWFSPDIAKGGRERWVPVLPDLQGVVGDIRSHVHPGEFVLPAQQNTDVGTNQVFKDFPGQACDGKTIWRTTRRIGRRAGLHAPVNPHMMRHAFADHITRIADVRTAQRLLGHADLSTTQGYLGEPTLDDLAEALRAVTILGGSGLPRSGEAATPLMETVGIEPTLGTNRPPVPVGRTHFGVLLEGLWRQFAPLRGEF